MTERARTGLAFLLDVDNTLIDNDAVKRELDAEIERLVGAERSRSFWSSYEEVRRERDFVDFPRTLERFRAAFPGEPRFPLLAALVLCYPYETSRYPGALEAVLHLKTLGRVVIVSDGDPVFQPAKIARAGFAEAVDEVIVTVHKERDLDALVRRIKAARYVLVDDKPRILAAAKRELGERLTTLHVCQGRYAHAAEHHDYPAADIEVDRIADVLRLGADDFRAAPARRGS